MATDELVEKDIRWAYQQCIRDGAHSGQQPGDWVNLVRILSYIDVPKAQFDRVIKAMTRRGVGLISEDNQKILTPADRAAAVHTGCQDKHLLAIRD